MNETTKLKSLALALEKAGCHELPKQYKESLNTKGYWISALCLVQKRNLDEIYVLAERGGDGYIHYTCDTGGLMGRMSPISKLISIHPYMYLDETRMSEYENKDLHWKQWFIQSQLGLTNEGVILLEGEKLKIALVDAMIKRQKESLIEDVLTNRNMEGDDSFEEGHIAESAEVAQSGELVNTDELADNLVKTEQGDFEKISEIAACAPRPKIKPLVENKKKRASKIKKA